MEVVRNLARLEGYPEGFAEGVSANTISEEDNVRAVLTKIELGEGDAAIVYVTDALSSPGVETIEIPGEANVEATYAAVTLGSSRQRGLAAELLAFLVGAEAQGVLASHGFVPVTTELTASPTP
jgi:molybdate transport system substrate-binding protein